MRKLSAILLLFAGFLCLSTCEAKCRRKNSIKLKRSLNLAISSDKINNRHQAGLRKIFRRKRNIKDKELKESDKFTAEIKFLHKWNPAMSKKDGSAYRLFEGNVLDAILEQMNADQRFINSRVLDLKKTSDGILAHVGFHFRKSEHNPISHIRFVVSRGHLSSLKVDKHYFKLLKTPAKFSNDNADNNNKTSTQQQQSYNQQSILQNKAAEPKQEPVQKSPAHQVHNESPSASVSSQTNAQSDNSQPSNTYPTPASTENSNQTQNEGSPQASSQNQTSTQHQATKAQSQDYIQSNEEQQQPKGQNQNLNSVNVQVTNQEQAQDASKAQVQNSAQVPDRVNAQTTDSTYSSNQALTQDEAPAVAQQQTYPQDQNIAVYQQTEQPSAQLYESQTTPNPSNVVQTQSNDQTNGNQKQPNFTTADNQHEPAPLPTSDDEENISIKMNQAWYPFLSNHDSLQYKMLTGNLEKGLKSVMGDDKNIKDIKVKNLIQADREHTTVEFLLKFNGAENEGSTEKLRNIVKSGDIAGISVDANFFKMEDNKVIAQK